MSLVATRYARAGEDSYVAYQVVGDGPIDLVYTSGWLGHVEAQWEYPALARFLLRLASFSRLICFDRRGHGLSDPIDIDNVTLEQWMEDVSVVMDAAGSERAALLGVGEGGPMTILFAATYPERTSALALVSTQPTSARHPDYPWGMPPPLQRKVTEGVQRAYWDRASADAFVGSLTSDERDQLQLERLFRYATSPGTVPRLFRYSFGVDVRTVLPSVRVPTLVVHRTEDRMRRVECGRHLAAEIAGARYVELPGVETHPWSGDQEAVLDEIEEFLTGVRPARQLDRVLATVLFTDIVDSTKQAAARGDRAWREMLSRHREVVRRQLARYRGREVNTSGDGFLATFDGPARAVHCASAIVESSRPLGIEVRIGLHTGEIELMGDDVGGIAVHIGARVSALAGSGEILVSSTVKDLVAGSGIEFDDRGERALKGVPGEWRLFAVRS